MSTILTILVVLWLGPPFLGWLKHIAEISSSKEGA
jgi:hypothetical protein